MGALAYTLAVGSLFLVWPPPLTAQLTPELYRSPGPGSLRGRDSEPALPERASSKRRNTCDVGGFAAADVGTAPHNLTGGNRGNGENASAFSVISCSE